jgi:Bax protein
LRTATGHPATRALLLASVLIALAALALLPTLILHWQVNQTEFADDREPPIWPLPDDETEARKAQLVNTLLPAIQATNRDLLALREQALAVHERFQAGKPDRGDLDWLQTQARLYRLDAPDNLEALTPDWFATLLRRIDIIPASLALAQGAIESAWGTSRFAQEGNNYFGQWCFTPGCGMVPARRPAGAKYEVERFPSVEEAVRRYMLNLNSHPRYRYMRVLREQARAQEKPLSGRVMAAGLNGYAEIGEVYISHIRSVIRHNDFDRFADF